MFKLTPPTSAKKAEKPKKSGTTFYAGIPHPLAAEIASLLASVAKGESTDIAGDLKKAQEMVESPAIWVGIGTQVRDQATGNMVPFMKDGKPILRGDSVIVYTEDPERDRSSDEKAGALIRSFQSSNQRPGFYRTHPYFVALESAYQAEMGVGAPATTPTQIPVGSAKAVPAGDEEVQAK